MGRSTFDEVYAANLMAAMYGVAPPVDRPVLMAGPRRDFRAVQAAVNQAHPGDVILAFPHGAGSGYNETVTVPRTKPNLTIIGMGGRGAPFIEPSTEDAGGMIVHADDVTLINMGIAGEDETAGVYALSGTGSRCRVFGCKLEGGERQVSWGPGTVAQTDADTHGNGADFLMRDCELAWGTNGIVLVCTDYGAVTQFRAERNHFHNLTGKHVTEAVGSGGAAGVAFRNVALLHNTHDDLEDGTAPTNYIDLNGDNANTGIVAGCFFPTAINSGLNLVSTAMHWVGNFHTGGLSTAQPS